jgi:hypothetical protein
MRETRPSGSEGGGAETNRPSLPLFSATCTARIGSSFFLLPTMNLERRLA